MFCVDYPSDWTDKYKDTCYHYEEFEWCGNGTINTVNASVTEIVDGADFKYDLNANQVCCECGGGVHLLQNEIIIVFHSSVTNNGILEEDDLLCEWPSTSQKWRQYDNLELYDLCSKLKENVYKNYKFTEDEETCILKFLRDAQECGYPSANEPWYPVINSIMRKYWDSDVKEAQEFQTL